VDFLFHIARGDDWEKGRALGKYEIPSLKTEGFIHCSLVQQVIRVANIRFKDQKGLVLLQINPKLIRFEIRYENLEGGTEMFPHIYGPIDVDAVTEVFPFTPDSEGSFNFPKNAK
jgi:uncharacterized protein (DUF952 family)